MFSQDNLTTIGTFWFVFIKLHGNIKNIIILLCYRRATEIEFQSPVFRRSETAKIVVTALTDADVGPKTYTYNFTYGQNPILKNVTYPASTILS